MDVLRLTLLLLKWLSLGTWWLLTKFARGTAVIIGWSLGRNRTPFGSARWASAREILFGNVLGGTGVILGRKFGRLLRSNEEGFTVVVAPARSGKGVGIVIPTLLDYQGAAVVADPKAENFDITARDRARRGPVFTLNLIDPGLSDRVNPLDLIRIGTIHEAIDADQLATLLVVPDDDGKGGHWDEMARQLISVVLRIVVTTQPVELRTLAKAAELVSSWELLQDALDKAASSGIAGARAFLDDNPTDGLKDVRANADKALRVYGADRPAGMITAAPTFDLRLFTSEVATLYLIVAEELLPVYGRFLRLISGCIINALTAAKDQAPKVPVLLLLDEAAALGRLEALETGAGYLASYAKMLLVFQDLTQLRRTYPKAESFLANAGTLAFFNINDVNTAEEVSKAIGNHTVLSRSAGQSQANLHLLRSQQNSGSAEACYPLVDPAQLLRLPRNRLVVFSRGRKAPLYPILAGKIDYRSLWRFRGRWDTWRKRRPRTSVIPANNDPLPTV